MMKKTVMLLLLILTFSTVLYAGSGDLIVTDKLGVGNTSPNYAVDVLGDVNITGNFKINGVNLPSALTGAISGLKIANDATYPNTKINVTANVIGTVVSPGTIGIDCTTGGQAAGNDLDTGTLQASQWYYIWAIYNGTTVAGLASLSSTSPAMPGGYKYNRLVGVAVTDSSANFRIFSQIGNHFVYDEYQQVSTGTTSQSWTTQNCSAFIPPITTRGCFQGEYLSPGNGGISMSIRKKGSSSTKGHLLLETGVSSGGVNASGIDWVDTDSSQNVQLNAVAAIDWYLRVVDFELNL